MKKLLLSLVLLLPWAIQAQYLRLQGSQTNSTVPYFNGLRKLSSAGISIQNPNVSVLSNVGNIYTTEANVVGSTAGKIKLFETPANGTNGVNFQAPSSMTADYTLTWPASVSAGTMTVDGSGNVAFSASGSGFDMTDPSKYYWRETHTPLFTDSTRRFGDNPWIVVGTGNADRGIAEIGHLGVWRFFSSGNGFFGPGNNDSGELSNKPYILGTNCPAMTIKFNFRFGTAIDGTDDVEWWIGLSDQIGGTTNRATNSIILQVDRSVDTTQFGAVTSTNNTATTVDTGTNFNTNWVSAIIAISQHATNVVFSIGGSTVATNSTNIPWDTQLRFGYGVSKVAGTDPIIHLDEEIIYTP